MFAYLKLSDLTYSSTMPELRPMLVRIVNAETSFKNDLIEQFGFSESDAQIIFDVYSSKLKIKPKGEKRASKLKAMKLDPIAGRWNLVHGGFWERESLDRCLAIAKGQDV